MLRTTKIALTVSAAICASLVASTVQAAVVQYEATLKFGFGEKNNYTTPATTVTVTTPSGTIMRPPILDNANNAVPACAATGITSQGNAISARQDFRGVAEVLTESDQGSVRLFNYTPANGFATDCTFINAVPGPTLTRRTGWSVFDFPGQGPNNPGTDNVAGTLGVGRGAGNQLATVTWATPGQQSIVATAGALQFGGAVAIAGFNKTILGITNMGNTLVGTLPVPINMGMSSTVSGAAQSPQEAVGLQSSGDNFWLKVCAPLGGGPEVTNPANPWGIPANAGVDCPILLPVVGKAGGLPWTTGTVRAYDTIGNFATTRTRSGGMTRNSNGTTGTIQLVAPAVLDISGLTPLGIAITADLTMTLVPEPSVAVLLGSGALGLAAIFVVRKRNS